MGQITRDRPKPLLPVAGRPLLDYLVEQIAALEGIPTIHLVSSHRFLDQFLEWAGTWQERLSAAGVSLSVHDDGSTRSEDRPGAVADLALLARAADRPDGALVAASDNLFLFPLAPMWEAFRSGGRNLVLTILEGDQTELRRSAVPKLGPDNRVLALYQKPSTPPSAWAVPALYCLTSRALGRLDEYLSTAEPRDELGSFISFLVSREPVYAFKIEGRRLHVGTPEALRRANEVLSTDPGAHAL